MSFNVTFVTFCRKFTYRSNYELCHHVIAFVFFFILRMLPITGSFVVEIPLLVSFDRKVLSCSRLVVLAEEKV